MEEPCTTALALDPPQVLLGGINNADSWRSVRKPPTSDNRLVANGISLTPTRGHDQFRVQFRSGFYETTWDGYGTAQGSSYVTRRRVVSSGPPPDA